jgi:hypothetical protein
MRGLRDYVFVSGAAAAVVVVAVVVFVDPRRQWGRVAGMGACELGENLLGRTGPHDSVGS